MEILIITIISFDRPNCNEKSFRISQRSLLEVIGSNTPGIGSNILVSGLPHENQCPCYHGRDI